MFYSPGQRKKNILNDGRANETSDLKLNTMYIPGCAVGIATGYGLDGRGVTVSVLIGKKFSPLHVVQIGSDAHPDCYTMGTKG
jgi:hypothetical protein